MTKKSIRPVRFTPDNLLRLQQLAAAGLSSIEIAKSMGSTPASVKNVCCRHKIKIPRKRRSASNTLAKLVARLPASLSAGFQRKAEQLQLSASVLASRLLEAIVVIFMKRFSMMRIDLYGMSACDPFQTEALPSVFRHHLLNVSLVFRRNAGVPNEQDIFSVTHRVV